MKDKIALELERNRKEWEDYIAMRDRAMLEFGEIKRHLQEPALSISQLTRILAIKPTTLLNWDIRVAKKFKIPEPEKRKWRRFSLLDLFGFKILKDLKKRGVIIERTMNLFWYVKNDFCQFDEFVSWAKGDDIIILYDYDKADVVRHSSKLSEAWNQLKELDFTSKYYANIPFGSTIRELIKNPALQKHFTETFRIQVISDNKLEITIAGKKTNLKDMPDKPAKLTVRNGVLRQIIE